MRNLKVDDAPQRRRGRPQKIAEAPDALPQIPEARPFPLPGHIYRIKEIATYPRRQPGPLSLSAASIWNYVRDGRFPAPIRIGPNVVGWRGEDLRDWLEGLSAARPAGAK